MDIEGKDVDSDHMLVREPEIEDPGRLELFIRFFVLIKFGV